MYISRNHCEVGEHSDYFLELDPAVGFRFVQAHLFAGRQSSRVHVFLRHEPTTNLLHCAGEVSLYRVFSSLETNLSFMLPF